MKTDEINRRAAEYKQPFNVSRQQVDGYRKRRKVDIEAIIQQDEMLSLTSGLAIKEVRVSRLKRLAELMEGDLFGDRLWTDEVKGIGSGPIAEIVEYEEFNRSEVDAYRGVLDDIAKELGHRATRTELSGADGGDLTIKVVEVVKQERDEETDDDGDAD
jgi:hypothetical protein